MEVLWDRAVAGETGQDFEADDPSTAAVNPAHGTATSCCSENRHKFQVSVKIKQELIERISGDGLAAICRNF